MILEGIVGLFAGAINACAGILPNDPGTSWATAIGDKMSQIIGAIKGLDTHFPATQLLICISLIILVMSASFIFRGAMWAYHQLPFNG